MVVLVVDDEPLVRMGISALPRELDHEVVEAALGMQALEKMHDHPHIDLLLTDYKMPGMSGIELADRCRTIQAGINVILMTGYSSQDHVFEADCPPRLAKPFGIRSLKMAIEQFI